MNIENKTSLSDIFGAAISGLCAIHCTLTPLLFATRPLLESTLGAHSHHSGWWATLDYVFLTLSLLAVWYSSRHGSPVNIKWILWLGWVVFAAGLISEHLHFPRGIWLMYAGSIALITAHLYSYRYRLNCTDEKCR